ncbi:MAG: hypothetical protein ACOYEV_02295 [Candidatus Nanopelagicales bacterium]
MRRGNQVAVDSAQVAIKVWTLTGIDMLLSSDRHSRDVWQAKLTATAQVAAAVPSKLRVEHGHNLMVS